MVIKTFSQYHGSFYQQLLKFDIHDSSIIASEIFISIPTYFCAQIENFSLSLSPFLFFLSLSLFFSLFLSLCITSLQFIEDHGSPCFPFIFKMCITLIVLWSRLIIRNPFYPPWYFNRIGTVRKKYFSLNEDKNVCEKKMLLVSSFFILIDR